ncbi:MAG: hypothetical protein ACOY3P_12465, partial [Planctomycetota bacterium]
MRCSTIHVVGAIALMPALLAVVPLSLRCDAADSAARNREDETRDHLLMSQERLWRSIGGDEPSPTTSSRDIFRYALLLGEVREHPDRLVHALELGSSAQDRDPDSPTYGNLKWTWRDAGVSDRNAVEFCSQDALLLFTRHGDWMTAAAREKLEQWLRLATEGCLKHRVPTSYTNIAILNAANLIVLGEQLDRPEATAEGCRRLDAICLYTAAFGTHEYCSPTYYRVNVDGLQFILNLAKNRQARQQAEVLMQAFWTDVASNWFEPAAKMAGTQSRSYDYVKGLGTFDLHLSQAGWIGGEVDDASRFEKPEDLFWTPPAALKQLRQAVPRLVRQSWGQTPDQSRTHMIYADVSLSTSGACYGRQDMPLTVDLPGDRELPRIYFIPDGREDPYGKHKYETGGAARHMKALHLQPFWAGAQRTCDALGTVVYQPADLKPEEIMSLQSHMVLRRQVDAIWIGGQQVDLPSGSEDAPARLAVSAVGASRTLGGGVPVVLRYGTAAVGIRVLVATAHDGRPAETALVDDGNRFGCLRLTIEHDYHRASDGSPPAETQAAVALWIRVGSGLTDEEAFQAWRVAFEAAVPSEVQLTGKRLRLNVPGIDGPVGLSAAAPWNLRATAYLPPPYCGPLEVNGRELLRPILEGVEPLR